LLCDIAAVLGDAKKGTVSISVVAVWSLSIHMLFKVHRIYLQDLFVSHISKDATSLTLYIMHYKMYLNHVHTVLNTCCLCKILLSLLKSMSFELVCLYTGTLRHRQAYGLFVVKYKLCTHSIGILLRRYDEENFYYNILLIA
jgi:hypothetical protein